MTVHVLLCAAAFHQLAIAGDTPLARGAALYRQGDYAQAAAAFDEGIAAGDAACMDYMGFLYLSGNGKRSSPRIALGYFLEAAHLGNDQACRNLGNMYAQGNGVDPDPQKAVSWWEKSLAQGDDPRPAFSLGQFHWLGESVPQDRKLAQKYWVRAKDAGSESAAVALAVTGDAPSVGVMQALAAKGHTTAKGAVAFLAMQASDTALLVKDVPFVSQAHNFCALASSTMMLKHQGKSLTQFDVARARKTNRWGRGSHWDEMIRVAQTFGKAWEIKSFAYSDEGYTASREALLTALRAGSPVIIDILVGKTHGSAHSIIMCGYSSETGEFLARNSARPFPGYEVFSEERLKEVWRSRGFIPGNSELLRPMMLAVTEASK